MTFSYEQEHIKESTELPLEKTQLKIDFLDQNNLTRDFKPEDMMNFIMDYL